MWLSPRAMARLYALPERTALMRLLATRDTWLGLRLLSGDPAAGFVRCAADLVDAALMVRNARSQQRALRTIRGRLLGAALSASCGLYAATGRVVTR